MVDLLTPANRALRALLVARGVESRTVFVHGHGVHRYRLSGLGSGPPLLLVHGLGSSANAFSRVLFELQPHFRVLWALDLPGNGFSPLPAAGPMSLETQVRVLLEFMRAEVGEPPFLIGNSLGGGLAMRAASEAPERVRALGLVAPAGARVEHGRMAALRRSLDVGSARQARQLTRRLFHRTPLAFELLAGQLRVLYGSAAVRGVLDEVRDSDYVEPERLARLSMPTVLVWGRSEKLLPYEGLQYFRANLPAHAEVHEVEGFGHMPQLERPHQLVELLLGFARRSAIL